MGENAALGQNERKGDAESEYGLHSNMIHKSHTNLIDINPFITTSIKRVVALLVTSQ